VWKIGEEIRRTKEKTNRVHEETQTQWTLIKKEKGIEHVIIVESLAIWPKTVGREIKQE